MDKKIIFEQQDVEKNATHWQRVFARLCDIFIFSIIGSFFYAGNKYTLFYLSFILELGFYTLFKFTPGKILWGVRVVDKENKKLSTKEYLKRNFFVLWSGFAFGIPIVQLFTLYKQEKLLQQNKPTTYDAKTGNKVIIFNDNKIRDFFARLITLIIICFIVYSYIDDFKNNSENRTQRPDNTITNINVEMLPEERQRDNYKRYAIKRIEEAQKLYNEGEKASGSEAKLKYADAWYTIVSVHPGDLQTAAPELYSDYNTLKEKIEIRFESQWDDKKDVKTKRIHDF